MTENTENLNFENALIQLENIVRELEGGKISLDDAVTAYEKATALKKICEDKLNNAKLRIEKIEKTDSDNFVATEFLPED